MQLLRYLSNGCHWLTKDLSWLTGYKKRTLERDIVVLRNEGYEILEAEDGFYIEGKQIVFDWDEELS